MKTNDLFRLGCCVLCFLTMGSVAQTDSVILHQKDTIRYTSIDTFLIKKKSNLQEVTVTAFMHKRPILRLPSSIVVVDSVTMQKQPVRSLVPLLNTVSGVRMEERSPGSYRLSIRGSLMRSPFGVRNTKIYLDEFPLTNAGGDAYLN